MHWEIRNHGSWEVGDALGDAAEILLDGWNHAVGDALGDAVGGNVLSRCHIMFLLEGNYKYQRVRSVCCYPMYF